MNHKTIIPLKTVTPIWTANEHVKRTAKNGRINNDPQIHKIEVSSILGTLRWWYEAILRGVGAPVKDYSTINYDEKKRDNGLCAASELFGATGWKRRFSMAIIDHTEPDKKFPRKVSIPRTNSGKESRWFFPAKPRKGTFDLHITNQFPHIQDAPNYIGILEGLTGFISQRAGFGARTQHGLGIVEATSPFDFSNLVAHLKTLKGTQAYDTLPDVKHMFFAEINPPDDEPFEHDETFYIKQQLRSKLSGAERHIIYGKVYVREKILLRNDDHPLASKIKISNPYDNHNTIRLWGWIPQKSSYYRHPNRADEIRESIYEYVDDNYQIQSWRQFESKYDTQQVYTDPYLFIKNLMQGVDS